MWPMNDKFSDKVNYQVSDEVNDDFEVIQT
jgi:hypothetical protein